MLKDGCLSKAEREMIVVATSGDNDCLYCSVVHGAILRVYAKNPYVADRVAADYRQADITPRQKAMLAFALKVARKAFEILDEDFAAPRAYGFSDEDIGDIGGSPPSSRCRIGWSGWSLCGPPTSLYRLGRLPKK
jgi:uncharacterized peroxidase-related enzyme